MVAMWAVSIFRTGLRRWLIILIAVSTGSLVSVVLVNHPSYVMNMKQHGGAGLQTHAIQDKIVTLTDFNQKCVDPDSAGGVEDTLCLKRPTYLPNFQNPCFLDWVQPLQKLRCLPYFHVLGVDKSGTTDLHARIALHPQVLLNNGALGKETYFWCWLKYGQWMKGVINPVTFSDYLRAFNQPTATIAINLDLDGNHSLITGDGTPMDFWDFRAWPLIPQNRGLPEPIVLTPHLMRHIYPDPKFIIILRNPTDRLYSDYIFLGYGWTPEQFRQDVPRAISMMEACLKVNTTRQCVFSNDTYITLPMRLHIGMYSVFMREWLDVFPLSHFYILRTEDYTVNMTRHLQQIFKFLRLEALPEKALQDIAEKDKRHETAAKKKVNDMFPETRHQLNQFYSRYNQELARMLGDEGFLWPSSPESQTATLVDSFLNLSNLSKMRLHIGMYSVFMREWLDVFPLSHFYILRTEDYMVNLTRHLQQIFKFLRLEALPEKALQDLAEKDKRHETAAKKKVNDMFPETRHQLNQFYSRYNQELARMLGDEGFLWPSSPETQTTSTLVGSSQSL